MKAARRDIAVVCTLGVLIVLSSIMNIRNGYRYDMTASSGSNALDAGFYNWWIILAISLTLLYIVSKKMPLQKEVGFVPVLSIGLLLYAAVSFFLF